MTNMADLDLKILTVLPFGNARPKTGRELATLFNVDIRQIKKCVNRLITSHKLPIVASRDLNNPGYFIPENDTELLNGIRELQAQHKSEAERLDALISVDLQEALLTIRELVL